MRRGSGAGSFAKQVIKTSQCVESVHWESTYCREGFRAGGYAGGAAPHTARAPRYRTGASPAKPRV